MWTDEAVASLFNSIYPLYLEHAWREHSTETDVPATAAKNVLKKERFLSKSAAFGIVLKVLSSVHLVPAGS